MVQPHSFLSSEIVPPINFTWTGDVSIVNGQRKRDCLANDFET